MKQDALKACIDHWLERVAKGDVAFRFKAVDPSHQGVSSSKRKRRAPLTDDEDEGPDQDQDWETKDRETEDQETEDQETEDQEKEDPEKEDQEMEDQQNKDQETRKGKEKGRSVPLSWYGFITYQCPNLITDMIM
jgi:hypothetical protein